MECVRIMGHFWAEVDADSAPTIQATCTLWALGFLLVNRVYVKDLALANFGYRAPGI